MSAFNNSTYTCGNAIFITTFLLLKHSHVGFPLGELSPWYSTTRANSSMTTGTATATICTTHQPLSSIYPKRVYGKEKIVYCSSPWHWFLTWPFLHYSEAEDAVYCHTCIKAFSLKRMKASLNSEIGW